MLDRSTIFALTCLVVCACVPGEEFVVADGAVDAPRSDIGIDGRASMTDGGLDSADQAIPLDGRSVDGGPDATARCDSVLGCFATCDDVLDPILMIEEFEDDSTAFRNIIGTLEVSGGDLTMRGGVSPDAVAESLSSFDDGVVSCTDGFVPPNGSLGHHLRGPQHGLTCYFERDRIAMFSLNPEGANVLVDVDRPHWLEEAAEVRMLIYLHGGLGYCEVQNLATGEVSVLQGAYGGERLSTKIWLEAIAGTGTVRVHRVLAGRPSAAAAAVLPSE